MGATMNNRVFGIGMLILCAVLLVFVVKGGLIAAPLLMAFATLGSLAGMALSVWALLGKY